MQCRKKLDTMFREEVQRRREDTTVDANKDLISRLMEMEDEQGKKLCDDEVVDNIVSLVVVAYESTSNAIMWAAYHLAKSSLALHKLRVS